MSNIDILMPALSPTMEEGTLAKWLVRAGDKVRPGDVIAEIETDKATMELEAVDEGFVAELLVGEGAEGVKVNSLIARLASQGQPADSAAPAPSPAPAPEAKPAPEFEAPILSPAARRIVAETGLVAEELTGSGRDGRVTKGDAIAAAGRAFASPLARRIAHQNGLDLTVVKGSGPRGRIIKADVAALKLALVATSVAAVEAPATHAARQPQSVEQADGASGAYDLVPLDNMRRVVAQRMTDSFRDVPHFPLSVDVQIGTLLTARAKINALLADQGVKVSVNDFVIKASAVALKRVPEANASYTPDGIARYHDADIAIAVALPGGLITPIIRRAQTKGLAEIAVEARDLAARARTKKLSPEQYQGGTFSISNLGMFGIKHFTSILNQPHGCILSVGAGEKRPVVRDDQLAVATLMTVTLTCDHRVVDGAVGARWLQVFKGLMEDPLLLML